MRFADWLVEGRWNLLRLPEYEEPHVSNIDAALASALSRGGPVPHASVQPVADVLAHAVRSGDVLLHGSNRRGITLFEPRDQGTYRGRPVRAVFATPDPVWCLFFAVTSTQVARTRWNMCLRPEASGRPRTRYFFSVGARPEAVWTSGSVYLLPRADFVVSDEPSEWIASVPVRPLAEIEVEPADFPFRHRVFGHREGESEPLLMARLVMSSLLRRSTSN